MISYIVKILDDGTALERCHYIRTLNDGTTLERCLETEGVRRFVIDSDNCSYYCPTHMKEVFKNYIREEVSCKVANKEVKCK